MNLPEAKIELATTEDKFRTTLQNVKLEGDRLIATDGHILASVAVQRYEEDTNGLIPAHAFQQARKLTKKKENKRDAHAVTITANGNVKVMDSCTKIELARPDFDFPSTDRVLADNAAERAAEITICLDAALLIRLAKALGAETDDGRAIVKLWVTSADKAAYVEASNGNFGLIMPCRVK